MKTLTQVIKENPQHAKLIRAVVKRIGRDKIAEVMLTVLMVDSSITQILTSLRCTTVRVLSICLRKLVIH